MFEGLLLSGHSVTWAAQTCCMYVCTCWLHINIFIYVLVIRYYSVCTNMNIIESLYLYSIQDVCIYVHFYKCIHIYVCIHIMAIGRWPPLNCSFKSPPWGEDLFRRASRKVSWDWCGSAARLPLPHRYGGRSGWKALELLAGDFLEVWHLFSAHVCCWISPGCKHS